MLSGNPLTQPEWPSSVLCRGQGEEELCKLLSARLVHVPRSFGQDFAHTQEVDAGPVLLQFHLHGPCLFRGTGPADGIRLSAAQESVPAVSAEARHPLRLPNFHPMPPPDFAPAACCEQSCSDFMDCRHPQLCMRGITPFAASTTSYVFPPASSNVRMSRGGGVRFPEKSVIWATRHLSRAKAATCFPRGPV